MRRVALSEIKDDLSRFLREAEGEGIVITRNEKPAGLLFGFRSEADWLDYRLENDPRFLRRIEQARMSLREGRGVRGTASDHRYWPPAEELSPNPDAPQLPSHFHRCGLGWIIFTQWAMVLASAVASW